MRYAALLVGFGIYITGCSTSEFPAHKSDRLADSKNSSAVVKESFSYFYKPPPDAFWDVGETGFWLKFNVYGATTNNLTYVSYIRYENKHRNEVLGRPVSKALFNEIVSFIQNSGVELLRSEDLEEQNRSYNNISIRTPKYRISKRFVTAPTNSVRKKVHLFITGLAESIFISQDPSTKTDND